MADPRYEDLKAKEKVVLTVTEALATAGYTFKESGLNDGETIIEVSLGKDKYDVFVSIT